MPSAIRNCFVDTTILVYAKDPKNPAKQRIASDLLRMTVRGGTLVLSVQSVNEFYRAAVIRRPLMPALAARRLIERLQIFVTAPNDFRVTQQAWVIHDEHRFSWWDCVLLASATLAGCTFFFSGDLQHHRKIGNLTVVNPFYSAKK
jgi:predicted nucleic acid-binding protein